MAKRAFDLGKLLKVSHKEVCYEQDGETIYLCDKRGYVGIQTDDLTVLADMAKRGIELTEKAGLKQRSCESTSQKICLHTAQQVSNSLIGTLPLERKRL